MATGCAATASTAITSRSRVRPRGLRGRRSRALPRLGFRGVNVTIPHKEAALALADTVSDARAR